MFFKPIAFQSYSHIHAHYKEAPLKCLVLWRVCRQRPCILSLSGDSLAGRCRGVVSSALLPELGLTTIWYFDAAESDDDRG